MKTTIKVKAVRSQQELRKHTPSPLFRAALYRSGAGIHAEDLGRYTKRDRAKHRQDERRACLNHNDAD
jgi:hypothetical protein